MMQNNLLKTILCVSLLSQTLYGAQQWQRALPPTLAPTDSPVLRPTGGGPTDSPQHCYLQPVTGFKKAFSQDNLDTLRPDQSAEALEAYETRSDFQAIAAHEEKTGNIIAAALKFLSTTGDKTEIWLKTLAIARNTSEKKLRHALGVMTQELKRESNGYPLFCNLKDDKADSVNVIVHAALRNFGWKPMHHFHKLTKRTHPLANYSPMAELTFASTRTATNLVPLQKIQIAGYDILAAPEILPYFDCMPADLVTYLDHPKCTIIVARLGETPVGAIIYTLPQAGHGKIEFIAVIPPMRKKGIAASLLRFTQEELFTYHNAQTVEINVLESNTEALRCYQKNGFEISSTMAKLRRSTTATPIPEFRLPPATTATTTE